MCTGSIQNLKVCVKMRGIQRYGILLRAKPKGQIGVALKFQTTIRPEDWKNEQRYMNDNTSR